MTSSRDQILSRVRSALAPLPQRAALPDWESEFASLRAARPATPDTWTCFSERLRAVNGTPLSSVADLVSLLEQKNAFHGYCDPAILPRFASAFPSPFKIETEFDRTRVDDYAFGITAAAGAIAETGTLILSDTTTSRRLGALAPWIHVAVLRRDQIQPDLLAATATLPSDPNIIFATGPSKTADIEGILIEGVHGPGVQIALLVE
jgi:L-lactate dehydrogenase complex protein LldG